MYASALVSGSIESARYNAYFSRERDSPIHTHTHTNTNTLSLSLILSLSLSLHAANDTERLLATVYTLMGAVIFALVIGNISEMAQQENRTTEAMSQTLHRSEMNVFSCYRMCSLTIECVLLL